MARELKFLERRLEVLAKAKSDKIDKDIDEEGEWVIGIPRSLKPKVISLLQAEYASRKDILQHKFDAL